MKAGDFDPEACIKLLLDKSELASDRGAAAESLGFGFAGLGSSLSRALDALYRVAADRGDELSVREEAAGSLGLIWSEIGLDKERFDRLPEDAKREVASSMPDRPAY